MTDTDPNIKVFSDRIQFKFYQSVKASYLTNEHFKLFSESASPTQIANPFQEIDIVNDYEAIGRVLTLYFGATLTPDTDYYVEIDDLVDAANRPIAQETYEFTTNDIEVIFAATPETLGVIDKSIKTDLFLSESDLVEQQNPAFYIESTDPADYLLAADQNNGRFTFKFNVRPSANFINPTYFKAQRKLITRGMTRWENVDALISFDATNPWVYVDFPSTDATPVYNTSGKFYFEQGYKYRVRVTKEVGT